MLAHAHDDLAAGMAAVASGKLSEAESHVRTLQAAVKAGGSAIAAPVLAAKIAEARDNVDAAIEQLKRAVELQDHSGYSEPPRWWFPVRESLGGVQLRAGRYADAERTFRADLTRNRDNPRSLFGLGEALRRQGDAAAAATTQAAFVRAWRHADEPLTVGDL
jgi:tetratricopeptide (TPR) repeat protein